MSRDPVMRRLRAANPEPTPRPESDELFEQIVSEPGDPRLGPSPAPAPRRPRWPHRPVVRWLAAPAAAAAIAAAVVLLSGRASLPNAGSGGQSGYAAIDPTTVNTLYRLAFDSAGEPPRRDRYVVLPEVVTYSQLPGREEHITSVVEQKTGLTTTYSPDLDLRRGHGWVTLMRRGELAFAGLHALVDPVPILRGEAWFTSLPTDPTTLRRVLVPFGALIANALLGAPVSDAETTAALDHRMGTPASNPQSAAVRDDDVYDGASDLLWSPLVQPALRAALYRVLATTPGVTVDNATTDPVGRFAIAMSRRYRQDGAQVRSTTWEDPSTGTVLAQRVTVHGPHAPATGTSTAVFRPITTTNTTPPNPYAQRSPTRSHTKDR